MEKRHNEFMYVTASGIEMLIRVLPDDEYKGEAIAQIWENKDGRKFIKVPSRNLKSFFDLLREIG